MIIFFTRVSSSLVKNGTRFRTYLMSPHFSMYAARIDCFSFSDPVQYKETIHLIHSCKKYHSHSTYQWTLVCILRCGLHQFDVSAPANYRCVYRLSHLFHRIAVDYLCSIERCTILITIGTFELNFFCRRPEHDLDATQATFGGRTFWLKSNTYWIYYQVFLFTGSVHVFHKDFTYYR